LHKCVISLQALYIHLLAGQQIPRQLCHGSGILFAWQQSYAVFPSWQNVPDGPPPGLYQMAAGHMQWPAQGFSLDDDLSQQIARLPSERLMTQKTYFQRERMLG
jgi:hypothetical protein